MILKECTIIQCIFKTDMDSKLKRELMNGRRIQLLKDTEKACLTWSISCKNEIQTVTYGQISGKLQQSHKEIQGKNIGRANETTPKEQNIKEAISLIKKKLDNLYKFMDDSIQEHTEEDSSEHMEGPKNEAGISAEYFKTFRPTLAFDLSKVKEPDYQAGVYVQIKYDGVRNLSAIVNGKVCHQSRNGKPNVNVSYLDENLKQIFSKFGDNLILDGELFLSSKNFNFEQLVGASKKANNSVQLQYHIYDCYDSNHPEATFKQRFLNRFEGVNEVGLVKIVQTFHVTSEEEMREKHAEFVAAGDEGLMIRNISNSYEVGKRSRNLIKVKDFQDSEDWKVVGFEEATGRDAGSVIFHLQSDDGSVKFKVRPAMPLVTRQKMYEECLEDFEGTYKGKYPTIKFQNLSGGKCVPRFPVLKCFRDDYE